jgi:translation initiation factor IF-3
MKKFYKINQYIKADQVRLISEEENLGLVPLPEALFKAKQQGKDLVQVTEKVTPPVCKIIDFQKFRYQQQKKDQSGKKKGKTQEMKEVRFTPFIGKGDFDARIKKIRSFLEDGDKVKITVKFTGRQITRKDFGNKVMDNALQELGDICKVEQPSKLQGKMLYMIIKPTGNQPVKE